MPRPKIFQPSRLPLWIALVAAAAALFALMLVAPVRAERDAPQAGGVFSVNGTGDNTDANSFLTLREALLLARGGTDDAGGLGRGLTDLEMAQITGCTYTLSSTTDDHHINGGCGAGLTDKIIFDSGLPLMQTIQLGTTPLPAVDDTAPTTIDGDTVYPEIDATNIGTSHNGLHITTGNNIVRHVRVSHSPANNFYIGGDHNTLVTVGSWSAGTNGVYLAGSYTTINTSEIGLDLAPFARCGGGKGNQDDGIQIASSAHNTFILQTFVACNGGNGVLIVGASSSAGAAAPATFVTDNQVTDSTVFRNGRNGIEISGVGASSNLILGTSIYSNTLDGINERNGASSNVWTQIGTWANGGLGIDVAGETDGSDTVDGPLPVFTSVSWSGGTVTLQGKASPSQGQQSVTIEIYHVATDPSGYGQGLEYIANTTTAANGQWNITFTDPPGSCYTAFQTRYQNSTVGTSSEFSANTCRVFLPLIRR